jgi:glycosyltransferase involved in cell wall biosynthesis
MHICFITAEYPIYDYAHGGIGTFIRNLGYKLVNHNHKVTIVRISPVEEYTITNDEGVEVHLLPESKLPFSFITNSFRINAVINKINKKSKIDIVETPELGLAFMKKIKNIKYIIRMNGGHHFFAKAENRPTEWKKVWQEKKSFKKADHVIAVSSYVAETTRELLNLGNIPINILYNPIDTNRFYQSDSNKVEKHTVFFAGTIIEKKGIRQLVQSLEYLIDDFPNIKLLIAGRDATIPGTNKPYKQVLDEAITDKIRPHIQFLGIIPNFDIPKYIEKANVCCYPSHMEAMPLAWLEVLAMGKIFIGSTTGPGPEAVHDGVTGFLVNPFNPEEISEKIRYVFNHSEESIAIGSKARQRVINEFDVSSLVNKNIEYYESIL